nr:copia protein [Tanacetum cinerariifolium]
DQGIFDSECYRHMTGNKSYLTDYQKIDGGFLLHLEEMLKESTLDESNLWHIRLGHINFKTMKKLVKGNLVRGLSSKLFENDHTCVAYQKDKQHKASWNQTNGNAGTKSSEDEVADDARKKSTKVPRKENGVQDPDTGIFSDAYVDEVEGAVADFNNLELTTVVYRNKKDDKGIVVRNKARLVAQGHTQEEGIDYDEFFALVAKIKAIRLFLAYASFMGFIVYQMDVKSAFLYGTIEEKGTGTDGSPRYQEAMGGSITQTRFERLPTQPHDSPLPKFNTLESDEGSITLKELTVICTTLSQKVESLEANLKQTKQVYGAIYTKLIIKVKDLEKIVKTSKARRKAKIAVFDDEEEFNDPSKQGRNQPEDQLGVLSAAKVLADTARSNVQTYTRRRTVSTGSGGISTASRMISIAKELVNIVGTSMPVTTVGMVDKGKGIMEESESDVTKTKRPSYW